MLEEDLEVAIKVVIVGNGAVGKSSMIQRYCKNIFTKDYKKTIGVDFLEKRINLDGEEILLMLWDTAGQEEFDALTKAYYRGAQGCVLAFSTTDRDSFEAIESWKQKVEEEVGPNIPTCLIQNKIDLIDDAVVSQEDANSLAKRLKVRFYRTSVKEDLNINEVFEYLAQQHLKRIRKEAQRETDDIQPSRQIGVFTTAGGAGNASVSNNNNGANSGRNDTITLQPNKSRVGKKKPAFLSNCSLI